MKWAIHEAKSLNDGSDLGENNYAQIDATNAVR